MHLNFPQGLEPQPVFAARPFQVRNSKAYEVELLIAPTLENSFSPFEKLRPVELPEQEWLRRGQYVDRVVVARDDSPARLVVPDPRWFALHKLWMSQQEERDPLKRVRDAKQGTALLGAVAERMPQFRLDDAFVAELPAELTPVYEGWRRGAAPAPQPSPSWARRPRP